MTPTDRDCEKASAIVRMIWCELRTPAAHDTTELIAQALAAERAEAVATATAHALERAAKLIKDHCGECYSAADAIRHLGKERPSQEPERHYCEAARAPRIRASEQASIVERETMIVAHDAACPALCIDVACDHLRSGHSCGCHAADDLKRLVEAVETVLNPKYQDPTGEEMNALDAAVAPFREGE